MITTTLESIHSYVLSAEDWAKLLAHLGKTKVDNEPLPYAVLAENINLDTVLLCCSAEPQYEKEWRLLAVRYARRVQHMMGDPRSIHALDVAEAYANGNSSDEELDDARAAAQAAVDEASRDDARAAARSAAEEATGTYAAAAVWDTARAAARAVSWNATGTYTAADAYAAERAAQKEEFLRVVGEGE